jgi:hypothetical protein
MATKEVIGVATASDPNNPGKRHVKFLEALEDAFTKIPAPSGGDVQTYLIKEVLIQYGGIGMVTSTKVKVEFINEKAPW